MKLGVLAGAESWYVRDMKRAAESLTPPVEIVTLSFSSLSATVGRDVRIATSEQTNLSRLDAVLIRSMPPGTLEQIVFRMNALHRLAASGTCVVNPPRCLEVAIDKYLALAELQAAGLPVPETRVTQDWQQALVDFQELGGDVVVKPMFGSEGRGILRISDAETAWRVFKTLAQLGHLIYQQVFVPHPGWDTRVLKIGDELYGMRRMNPHDFRTNVSQGGSTAAVQVDDRLRMLACRAADAVGAWLAGVDILRGLDGEDYVLEVNAVPGWRAIARTLGVDVGRQVLSWLTSKVAH